jgi:hypothetical protein
MYKAYTLPPVIFAFNNKKGADKFRGLQDFGPHQQIKTNGQPTFGFVFPSQYRDYANRLYLALKNGIGYFRGVESAFRFTLDREHVFSVTGFTVPPGQRANDAARAYTDAILSWLTRNNERPDMFFILHPRTPSWEGNTPYYQTKAALLQKGILSQSVTFDLIDDSSVFTWSVANIALAAFVKLGGVPWLVHGEDSDQDLVIGVGRADVFDPHERTAVRYIGYTACFSARGRFQFVSLADVARTRTEYLNSLRNVVSTSLDKVERSGSHIASLTIHLPKEISYEESIAVGEAVRSQEGKSFTQISIVKVTDEDSYFVVDNRFPDGIPSRGTVIQTGDKDFMLYTEGREEKQSFRKRLPTALRIAPQTEQLAPSFAMELIRQVHDLSQVNWRAFNARSRPISILYGELIAKILSHVPQSSVNDLYTKEALKTLEERMWFI